MIDPTKYALPVFLSLVLVGCEAPRPAPPGYRPRAVVELARWRVVASGDQLGELVEYEIRDPNSPVRFYRVLDRSGRWVGHADANGRFSRRVPFEEREKDLGVWSMERGCALLLASPRGVSLEPLLP